MWRIPLCEGSQTRTIHFETGISSSNLVLARIRTGPEELERRVGTVEELDGCEDEFSVPDVFEVMHHELADVVMMVSRVASSVLYLGNMPVSVVRASLTRGYRRPEAVQHMRVETYSLAGLQA